MVSPTSLPAKDPKILVRGPKVACETRLSGSMRWIRTRRVLVVDRSVAGRGLGRRSRGRKCRRGWTRMGGEGHGMMVSFVGGQRQRSMGFGVSRMMEVSVNWSFEVLRSREVVTLMGSDQGRM